jgi:NAD(P)-dependent dehydrogenase (short-subunit alcohol dehydrogenase family)
VFERNTKLVRKRRDEEKEGNDTDVQLKGKSAIVTGGTAGIGLARARMLAEEGVEVWVPGRRGKRLREATDGLSGLVHGIETDLATAEDAGRLGGRLHLPGTHT